MIQTLLLTRPEQPDCFSWWLVLPEALFGQTVTYDLPRTYSSVSIGDLTGDGLPELVAGGVDCTLLINDGNLRFHTSLGSPYNVLFGILRSSST
ncbi:MAG: hypothetical protein ABR568_15800 [Pyrinomonadaceae bacterium]